MAVAAAAPAPAAADADAAANVVSAMRPMISKFGTRNVHFKKFPPLHFGVKYPSRSTLTARSKRTC